jgi:hypothetical protein
MRHTVSMAKSILCFSLTQTSIYLKNTIFASGFESAVKVVDSLGKNSFLGHSNSFSQFTQNQQVICTKDRNKNFIKCFFLRNSLLHVAHNTSLHISYISLKVLNNAICEKRLALNCRQFFSFRQAAGQFFKRIFAPKEKLGA